MRFLPVNRQSIMVELADLQQTLVLLASLQAQPIEGVQELVPAARTILVYFSPQRITAAALVNDIASRNLQGSVQRSDVLVEIPVHYRGEDLAEVAQSEGRAYSQDANLEAGLFYRADHFAFAQAGVPAITIGPGTDQLDGGVEGGKAARAKYFANCYHQPCDEFDDSWDMRGPVQDTRTVYRLAQRLANGNDWPQWDEGSEFRAQREKSAAARAR